MRLFFCFTEEVLLFIETCALDVLFSVKNMFLSLSKNFTEQEIVEMESPTAEYVVVL